VCHLSLDLRDSDFPFWPVTHTIFQTLIGCSIRWPPVISCNTVNSEHKSAGMTSTCFSFHYIPQFLLKKKMHRICHSWYYMLYVKFCGDWVRNGWEQWSNQKGGQVGLTHVGSVMCNPCPSPEAWGSLIQYLCQLSASLCYSELSMINPSTVNNSTADGSHRQTPPPHRPPSSPWALL
jgi:hypothetical protein